MLVRARRCPNTAQWLPADSQLRPTSHSLALYLSCCTRGASVLEGESHVPYQPSAFAPPCLHLPRDLLPPLPQPGPVIYFCWLVEEKLFNLGHSNLSGVLQRPSSEDLSPNTGPCTQRTRLWLPMSHARQ